MHSAQRDVDRLVFAEQFDVVVNGHARCALDHDPMFGAVVVRLQRQRRAGVHHDAFDLKPRANHEAFEPTPGAVILGKGGGLFCVFVLERCDGQFHVLGAAHVGDQNRVGHRHGHDVLQANAHHLKPVGFRAQQRVVAINRGGRTAGRNAAHIGAGFAPHRVPTAQIGPARPKGHDRQIVCALHHRVVDRHVARRVPRGCSKAQKPEVSARGLDGLADGGDQIRGVGGGGINHRLRGAQKQPRVPQIRAGRQHLRGGLGVGLFDKTGQRRGLTVLGRGRQFKVAVGGFGMRRRDPEGHDLTGARSRNTGLDRSAKRARIRHHVIGRGNQHQRLRIGGGQMQGCGQNRRGGVAR